MQSTECAQDSMGRYCGDMIRNQDFGNGIQVLMTTCGGIDNCSGECQTAIEFVSTAHMHC